jgi:hypothetical protein
VLLRAGVLFVLLALLWLLLAPLYAHFLAALVRPLIPSIESSPGTRYTVEGTRIVAVRPIMRQTVETVRVNRQQIRDTASDYPLALPAALVFATPAWSLQRRGKVFAITVGLLILTQHLSLLVNIEYTKLWPQQTAAGLVVSSDYSPATLLLT